MYVASLDGSVTTVYMHLNEIDAQEGNYVTEGAQIGTIGNSSSGKQNNQDMAVHLHYEIHLDGGVINPTNGETNLIDVQQLIPLTKPIELPEVEVTYPVRKERITIPPSIIPNIVNTDIN